MTMADRRKRSNSAAPSRPSEIPGRTGAGARSGIRVYGPALDHPWVDDSRAPLYYLTYPKASSDRELADGFAGLVSFYKTVRQPIAWVVDCTNVVTAPATQRRLAAKHLEEITPYSKRWDRAVAMVITTSWTRGLMTAIFWLSPPVFPYSVFADRVAATKWAGEALRRAYAFSDLPPPLR